MANFEDEQQLGDLSKRLSLIEDMIAEGRRTTARWGWSFVLWGTAYLVAMAWADYGHSRYAWAVTMPLTAVVGAILGFRQRRNYSGRQTTIGRAMMAIWTSMGLSMFLFGFGVGASGHGNLHVLLAGFEIILGMAYMASSIILRWKLQFACALLWWVSAMVSSYSSIQYARLGFAVATFICMIAFGIYSMVREGGCLGDIAHA